MIDEERYEQVQQHIFSIIDEAGSSIDPADLLANLYQHNVSRELGSTIMWEMIGAGRINRRAEDWHLSRSQGVSSNGMAGATT